MIKDSITKLRYLHKLTEDVDVTLKAGITLHTLCSPDKLNQYSAWNGTSFSLIPSDKVKVYKVTTTTVVEEEIEELI